MTDAGENLYSLGAWVRRRRKALDLTQAALAECVGCAEITIRKLEADGARPSSGIAERLATCLALLPDDHALFLQVARGECSVDRLPPPLTPIDPTPRSPAQVPLPVARLPRDTVPAPAPLPPESRMPLSRNPLFVGRDADLRQLAQALHTGGTAVIGQVEIAAATGLGGIGKTQLACEFVHRYGQFFAGGVFWLSFADPAAVPAEVAACGGGAGMQLSPEFDMLSLDEQIQRVLTAWASPLPRLLVFDNCEEEALLHQWRPKHGGCRILITSRRHHWDVALGVHPLPLDVLVRSDSLTLLRSFRPDLPADDADLHAIAATLGDLPLALHLAGSFLAKYRHALTPAQYLDRLHAPMLLDDRSLQAAGLSPTQHVQHVARTFAQSYERLDPADPVDTLALRLLAHAAYFAPGEPLPRSLLLKTLALPDDDSERTLLAADALARLTDLGLLETDGTGDLRLHRLVVAFVRAVATDAAAQTAVETMILNVATSLNQARDPRPGLALESHLRFITDAAVQQCTAQTAGLLDALGMHLYFRGAYAEAQHYVERGLAIRTHMLGADHPETARTLQNLAVVLAEQGQYAEARGFLERALEIRERVLGADHPDTASCLLNLAVVLTEQGQYAEARGFLERALEIRERVLGADHPETARTLQNLAVVLRLQGQYAEARGFLERTLEIRERVLGADHPDTASCLLNLAVVLTEQGQYADAQRYAERALDIWEQVLGANHPDMAWCLQYIGDVLRLQGEYVEARRYAERALDIRERVLGADHPDTARCQISLGRVLQDQGTNADAQGYVARAVAIFEQRLGPLHPETQAARMLLTALDLSETAERGV